MALPSGGYRPATSGWVRTALGDVDPAALGHTQPHEHLLCDMSPILHHDRQGHGLSAGERARAEEPITLQNYDWVRRNVLNWDNLRLLSEEDAVDELTRYRVAGGGAVVDSTPVGLGRDPLGCARISRASGVHVVVGSGYYVHDYHPAGTAEKSRETITGEIVRDLTAGIGDTGIRAGIIGEIGLSWPVHPTELTVLQAAARAQVDSGAPLQIHPGRDPRAPLDALRHVSAGGGVVERTIMSHIDRTLWNFADILALAETGCYLELDLFGQEASYYAFNPHARRPNDATRIEWLALLIDAGHRDQLLISQDICQKVYLRRYGGSGYTHILDHVVPQMRRMGLSDEDITAITRDNPARILAWC